MRKLNFILWMAALLISLNTAAQYRPEAAARCGDSAYIKGNYHEAIALYKSVMGNGYESAGLYYNLGNACYKTGDLPSAILYYERSLKLDPGNENTLYNLQLANSKIVDKIEPVPLPVYLRVWKKITELFTRKVWAVIIIILIALALVFVAIYLLAAGQGLRKAAFWLSALLFLLFLCCNIVAYSLHLRQNNRQEAVIFEPALTVKSSPDDSSTDIFVVHEGTKVRVTDQIGAWSEIRITGGSVGWVKTVSLKEI